MDPRPIYFKTTLHEILFVFVICMAQLLAQGGITMSLTPMNIILDSFAENSDSIEGSERVWFMGSFALTVGTFILISGRLGDLFGLKQMLLVGWAWVVVWAIVTGLSYYSHSIIFFIICRAFQGIGFALILPCALGILGNIYPIGDRKNLAFGCVGASGPVGATFGAIFAAILAELAWWPWVFWILAIVACLLGITSFFIIPNNISNVNSELDTREKLKRMDILGSTFGIVSLVIFNFVWNQGPVEGWDTPYIIVLLIISSIGIISFFYIELKVAEYPLLPKSIFNFKIGLLLLCISFGWGSFGIWQYYYWSIVLNLRQYTPIAAGLTYIPFFVLGIIAALSVSVLISKIKPSYIICFASVSFMCGCIMLSIMPVDQSYFQISMGQMFLLAWGMDLSYPAAALILSDFLPLHHQGMAGSLVSTVVNYSVSLFLGIASTVEIQTMQHHHNTLKSYRAAIYMGIGVAFLGVLFAIIFIVAQHTKNDPDPEITVVKEPSITDVDSKEIKVPLDI